MTNTDSQLAKIDDELNKVSFPVVDLNNFEITDLDEAEVMPIELTSLYWTPVENGEEVRVVFLSIENVEMPPMSANANEHVNENGLVWVECAYFMTSDDNGKAIKICNASKRLISTLKGNFIKKMTPLVITYKGAIKNKTNAHSSASFSVKPLNVKTIFIAEKVKEDIDKNANDEVIGFKDESEIANNAGNGASNANQPANVQTEVPEEQPKKPRFT